MAPESQRLSTIISGVQKADAGQMKLEGRPYNPSDSIDALADRAFCIVLQEKGTFDSLSVARNILIGKERQFSRKGFIDNARMVREAQKVLDQIHAQASSTPPGQSPRSALKTENWSTLSPGAMAAQPRILIIDETSTALSREGRHILYQIMTDIKNSGNSVIFISHDIDELMDVCDTLTILRDGDRLSAP